LNVTTLPCEAPFLNTSHPLSRLYINKGGTEQPAARTQQTAVVRGLEL